MCKKRLLAVSVYVVVMSLVLLSLTGCASAGTVVWSDTFEFDGEKSKQYTCHPGGAYGFTNNIRIDHIFVNGAENWAGSPYVTLAYDMDHVQVVPGSVSYYIESDLYIGAAKVGECTHGYTKPGAGGADMLYYSIFFDDLDLSGYEGRQYIEIETTMNVQFRMYGTNENKWSGGLAAGDCIFGWFDSLYKICGYEYGETTPDHYYSSQVDVDFCNDITITDEGGFYKIFVDKTTACPHKASTWHVVDSDVQYINETTSNSVDQTSYVTYAMFDSFCDGLTITAEGVYETDYSASPGALCDFEPFEYSLSGKTYSIYGNIVPGANVTYQSDLVATDELGYFQFIGCSAGGGSELKAVKEGYHNATFDFLGTSAVDYWIPVYMLPVDVLDTSEFGGMVYDYCTLEPILGAYVYLFNETADSGSYAHTNKYGFYRFAGLEADLEYEVSASKDGYDASIVHSFTFNESNVNETHRKTMNIWLLPEGGCPEDGGIPTPPPAPTPTPHEWTNEEIVCWLRVNLMGMFIIVLIFTFLWFIRKAGGSKR